MTAGRGWNKDADMLPIPLSHIALVALGGAVGASSRFVTVHLVTHRTLGANLPWGTFAVNLIGSFLIGAVLMTTLESDSGNRLRLLLVTGFLGGFTTFSAFSWELTEMLTERRVGAAALYSFGSVLMCLTATFAGALLMRTFAR